MAALIRPFITVQVQDYLSLVGSILIFCIGLNLVWEKNKGVKYAACNTHRGYCSDNVIQYPGKTT